MIEAYEIGIKLALQDGVSEGIAAIRRDLGSLDVVIAQTTLRLGQLQRIGAQALSAVQEQPERMSAGALVHRPAPVVAPPTPHEPGSEPAPERVEASVVMTARSPLQRSPASLPAIETNTRAPVGEHIPVSAPAVVRLDAVPVAAVRAPTAADAVRATGGPRSPELPATAPLANAVPSFPPPTVASAAKLVAPTLQTGDVLSRTHGPVQERFLPRAAGRVSSAPTSTGEGPQEVRPASGRWETVRQATRRPGKAQEVHVPQSVPSLEYSVARPAPAAARPDAVASPPASMTRPAASSYAPPAASPRAREASMRGDVFLDGARVGRWMSEQMARDAGRPNTGPTGFDPRRSPAWPGAAVTW